MAMSPAAEACATSNGVANVTAREVRDLIHTEAWKATYAATTATRVQLTMREARDAARRAARACGEPRGAPSGAGCAAARHGGSGGDGYGIKVRWDTILTFFE